MNNHLPAFREESQSLEKRAEAFYKVIQEWFEQIDLETARNDLDNLLDAAIEKEYAWNDGAPSNCLRTYDQIVLLMEAAHELSLVVGEKGEQELADAKIVLPELETYILFPDEYPRFLNANEWRDPIRVIHGFFRAMNLEEWKKEFHLWFDSALDNHSIVEDEEISNMLHFYRYLHRMIEACYVIKVQFAKIQ